MGVKFVQQCTYVTAGGDMPSKLNTVVDTGWAQPGVITAPRVKPAEPEMEYLTKGRMRG